MGRSEARERELLADKRATEAELGAAERALASVESGAGLAAGIALAKRAAQMERDAPLKKFKDGAKIVGHGASYVMRNVQKGGGQVSMTLERTDKRRRPEGMSPRQFRNAVKAERRLERDRKARRLANARALGEQEE